MVVCLGQGADLHMAQLMPVPLTVSCSSQSRLVLPFWCRLTWVVPDTIQEGRKMVVCVCDCTVVGQAVKSSRLVGGRTEPRTIVRIHILHSDNSCCSVSQELAAAVPSRTSVPVCISGSQSARSTPGDRLGSKSDSSNVNRLQSSRPPGGNIFVS